MGCTSSMKRPELVVGFNTHINSSKYILTNILNKDNNPKNSDFENISENLKKPIQKISENSRLYIEKDRNYTKNEQDDDMRSTIKPTNCENANSSMIDKDSNLFEIAGKESIDCKLKRKIREPQKEKNNNTFSFQFPEKKENMHSLSNTILVPDVKKKYKEDQVKQNQTDVKVKNSISPNNNIYNNSKLLPNPNVEIPKEIKKRSPSPEKKKLDKSTGLINYEQKTKQEHFEKMKDKYAKKAFNKMDITRAKTSVINSTNNNSTSIKNKDLKNIFLATIKTHNYQCYLIAKQIFIIYLKVTAIELYENKLKQTSKDVYSSENQISNGESEFESANRKNTLNAKSTKYEAENSNYGIIRGSSVKFSKDVFKANTKINTNLILKSQNNIQNLSQLNSDNLSSFTKSPKQLNTNTYISSLNPLYLSGYNKHNILRALDDIEKFVITSRQEFEKLFKLDHTINVTEIYSIHAGERIIDNKGTNESHFSSSNDSIKKSNCIIKIQKKDYYEKNIKHLYKNYHRSFLRPDEVYYLGEEIIMVYNVKEEVKVDSEEKVFFISRQMFIFLEYCHKHAMLYNLNIKKNYIIIYDEIADEIVFSIHDFQDLVEIPKDYNDLQKATLIRRDYHEVGELIYEWSYGPFSSK